MDQVFINQLGTRGVIGINDSERYQAQDILVSLTLFGDTHQAAMSDNIQDCINYHTIAQKTIALVETATRYTVEALAADIAQLCLKEVGVQGVRVRVEKPAAAGSAKAVGVEIERFLINDSA